MTAVTRRLRFEVGSPVTIRSWRLSPSRRIRVEWRRGYGADEGPCARERSSLESPLPLRGPTPIQDFR